MKNDVSAAGPAIIIFLDDSVQTDGDEVAQFLGHLVLPGVRKVEVVPPDWTIRARDLIGSFTEYGG